MFGLLYWQLNAPMHKPCIADYFSIDYKGETPQTINKTITANNEIILAGGIPNSLSLFGDGFLSKLTPYGTVVWSKRFLLRRDTTI
ncbi:MAG: hypothetical protein WDO71_07330 [Bacteroidota bacterium]